MPDCGLNSNEKYLTTLNNVGSTTLYNAVIIKPEQAVRFLLCR